jgi:hypothetical protein
MKYFQDITLHGKIVRPKKSIINPIFDSKNILVNDSWNYVDMWLKKNTQKEALFYWQQARQFFEASLVLPNTSSPLTSYYCFLNATKTLLLVKKIVFADRHGVSGKRRGNISFDNETVSFKNSGILSSMQKYFEESVRSEEYTLKQLLQNLIFIHRAYNLTYTSSGELFIPLKNVRFVKATKSRTNQNGVREFWLCAEFDTDIIDGNLTRTLAMGFKYVDGYVVSTKRFKWKTNDQGNKNNIKELEKANKYYRKKLTYIKGLKTHWYLKKENTKTINDKSMPTLSFAIMHRLSELSRYSPNILAKYLESKNNWLLAEFLDKAKYQFIDKISSEITGYDFVAGKNLVR